MTALVKMGRNVMPAQGRAHAPPVGKATNVRSPATRVTMATSVNKPASASMGQLVSQSTATAHALQVTREPGEGSLI